MEFETQNIPNLIVAQSKVYFDDRGSFQEWYKASEFTNFAENNFIPQQANMSISKRGVLRGMHFSTSIDGQSKWITCNNGAILDVVVDIRKNSPTYMQYFSKLLKAGDGVSIIIGPNLAHGFLSLENQTVVSYLLSSNYSPHEEFTFDAFDTNIGIPWCDYVERDLIIRSTRDESAPSLSDLVK